MSAHPRTVLVGVLVAVCAACSSSSATAPTPPPPVLSAVDTAWTTRLQRALDSAVRAVPLRGASAAVVLADGRRWRGVAGFSEPGVPMDPAMRLGMGSVSKSITATVLVRLAERGRLSLDDPLSRWLPPFPHVDPAITVRQLLNHSSGVYDVTDAPGYRDSILANTAARWTPQRTLGRLRPPLFARGTGWSYSNSNYLLAGLVAEAVGGRPLHQQVRDDALAFADLGFEHHALRRTLRVAAQFEHFRLEEHAFEQLVDALVLECADRQHGGLATPFFRH